MKKKIYYKLIRLSIIVMVISNFIFILPFLYDNTARAGSTYYVSTTGDDTTGTGSEGNPWRHIDHVVNNHLSAGDTLYVRGGTYNEHVHMLNKDGTSANWITIKNYTGETPIIDGDSPTTLTGFSESHGLFTVENSDYILLDGLFVRDCHTGSDLVSKNCNNITIQNCHTYGTPHSGIRITNSNDQQTGTYAYDTKCLNSLVQLARHDYGSGDGQEALDILACNRFEVAYCEVDNTNIYLGLTIKTASINGIVHHNNLYSGEQCFYMGNSADPATPARHQRNITIYNNWMHGGGVGSPVTGIGGEKAGNYMENITFLNNIFDASGGSAYEAFASINPPSGIVHVANISFINNIFISVRTSTTLKALKLSAPGSGSPFWWTNVIIRNNIFKCVGGDAVLYSGLQDNHPEEMTVDHNLYYTGTDIDNMAVHWDTSPITDNPDWISSTDFHLQPVSPCIDAGSSIKAPSFDYDDLVRPWGSGFDIGAFEYGSSGVLGSPSNFIISGSTSASLNLSWTKNMMADTTRIQRKTSSYPTSYTDGTTIYNNTGSSYTNNGLSIGQIYYYRAWSYTDADDEPTYSTSNASVMGLTKPSVPTSGTMTLDDTPVFHVHLSWTKGTGSNKTVIISNTGHMPTSYIDGTVVYNNTGTSTSYNITEGITTYFKAYAYTVWDGLFQFSSTGLEFISSLGMYINCYDEASGNPLTFSVFITNSTGSEIYTDASCTNTLVVNTSLLPTGIDCQIIINASGHYSRSFTTNIYNNIVTYLNVYLPSNSTSYLYYLRIVEGVDYQYSSIDIPIEDATVIIQRYEANEGKYTNISILKTDANGYVNLYLMPDILYKVFIIKTGYVAELSNYFPQLPNEWGQTTDKIFRIIKIADDGEEPPVNYIEPVISVIRIDSTIYANYTDAMDETISVAMYFYFINDTTGEEELITTIIVLLDNTVYNVLPFTDTTLAYKVIVFFNHTYYGQQAFSFILDRVTVGVTTPATLNVILVALLGNAGAFVWTNLILWLAFVVMMFNADKKNAGKYLILIGGVMAFVAFIGFSDAFAGTIPVLFVIVGIILEWINAGR